MSRPASPREAPKQPLKVGRIVGETNRPLFAVKPGATGDLTTAKDAPLNEHVGWFLPRFSAYTSSPLLYRGRVYAVNDNGILQVADAKTGKEIYKSRVGTGSATFSSSPLASAGKIYLLSEDGDMYVVEAGDESWEVPAMDSWHSRFF